MKELGKVDSRKPELRLKIYELFRSILYLYIMLNKVELLVLDVSFFFFFFKSRENDW